MQRYLYITLFSTLLLQLLGCGEGNKKSGETIPEQEAGIIVVTKDQFRKNNMALGSLEEQPFPIIINTTGRIDVPPENRASISAVMGGYIKKTPLLVGDTVKKGQALVTIENPEFVALQQEYLEVKEQLTYLKSEYERQKILFDENISSQKSFLKTESNYKTANAKYNGLRKQLNMLHISPTQVEKGIITEAATIYSPIKGSITKVNVSMGSYVSPVTPILEIVDNDHIHLELSVFEKDIMKLKKGQLIHFKIPEASDDTFEAEVYLIGTSIEENRTIKVHAHLKNESGNKFLTGMFTEAIIFTDSVLAKALPSEAIVLIDENAYILVLEKENEDSYHFRQLQITQGSTYSDFTELRNTEVFEPTNRFLIKGAFDLIGE